MWARESRRPDTRLWSFGAKPSVHLEYASRAISGICLRQLPPEQTDREWSGGSEHHFDCAIGERVLWGSTATLEWPGAQLAACPKTVDPQSRRPILLRPAVQASRWSAGGMMMPAAIVLYVALIDR